MFCGYAYRIFLGFVCSGFLLPPCSYKSLADQRGQQLLPGLLLAGRSRLQAKKVATYPPDVLSGHLCFCHERQHLGVQFLLGAISVFQHTQKIRPRRHPGEIPKNLPVPIACSRVAVSKEALNTNKCWRKAGKKTWFWEELQKPKRTPRVRYLLAILVRRPKLQKVLRSEVTLPPSVNKTIDSRLDRGKHFESNCTCWQSQTAADCDKETISCRSSSTVCTHGDNVVTGDRVGTLWGRHTARSPAKVVCHS